MKTYMLGSEILDRGHPVTVALVGAGGTGSQVLTHLARMHRSLLAMAMPGLHVTLYDDDIVTEFNMGRQLFSICDIGEYKAKVLIERINRFYGTFWNSEVQKIDGRINYKAGTDNHFMHSKIVISCVDNVKSRRAIKKLYDLKLEMKREYTNEIWIDTGNTQYTGQVIMGCHKLGLPDVCELFPHMHRDENKNDTVSCSVAEALTKQDLFINSAVALLCSQLLWDIVHRKTISWAEGYINLNSMNMITKRKFTDEADQVQNTNRRPRANHRQGKRKAGKTVKKTGSRKKVQRRHQRSKRPA